MRRDSFLSVAIARFKDLCLGAGDPARLGAFWAAVLDRTWEARDDGEGLLRGLTPQHTIWVNRVPEAKTVKQRMHLDTYTRELANLEALGTALTAAEPLGGRWPAEALPSPGCAPC